MPRRRPRSPRPARTCARWPATSRRTTSRRRCSGGGCWPAHAGRSPTTPIRTEPTHDRTPHARPHDPRDPGLPRREHLVIREGDPPGRRPRVPGEVPHQHAPRLHRQHPPDAARPAGALLLARPPRRVRRAAQRGHLARPRRRARGAGPPAGGRPRHPARQDAAGQGTPRRLQRGVRLHRRAGGAGRRQARHPRREPPGRGRSRVRLGRRARVVHPARGAYGVRSLHAGTRRRGRLARHPVDPAQPALARPARPGRPRQADPGHDDLRDRVHRGRHRLRQGPHHQAARRGRPAGAEAGLRAHGGPGGARSPTGSATPSS